MQDSEDLNAELSRRISAFTSTPNSQSEFFESTRPVLYEALIWVVGALILWVAAVIFI
jgi:hypothetical protein